MLMESKMNDIYCKNMFCPFKECIYHLYRIKDMKDICDKVTVADLDGVCRKYISYVVDKTMADKETKWRF